MNNKDKILLVIGGGAAGLFCAVNAARLNPSLKVIVAEKSGKLLSKVRISGGGRCNLTHACPDIAEMIKKYPRGAHFVKKAFHQFFTTDTVRWFEERGTPLKTEEDGRMFPLANTSQAVIDCLMKEADRYGVEILMHREADSLQLIADSRTQEEKLQAASYKLQAGMGKGEEGGNVSEEGGNGFIVKFTNGEELHADYVCVACGGYPKTAMFDWLVRMGHSIEAPVPSLFTFNMPGHTVTGLMGVSVADVQVKITGTKLAERGPVLITHWGLSGPAILRLSAWGARELAACGYEFTIVVNWSPGFNEQSAGKEMQSLRFELASQKISARNPFGLPARLWEWLLGEAGIDSSLRWADLPAAKQNKLVKGLCAHEFPIKGKTTFKEEFVTAGGLKLSEVDPNTMQSKRVPNLFFAGEVLDVDGITGGYNFQHAWTSGFIAAKAISVCSKAKHG